MAKVLHHYGAYIIVTGKERRLVQTDWDYPAEAEGLGWSLRRVQMRNGTAVHLKSARKGVNNCGHRSTDGTVKCEECGISASSFIRYAAEYLDGRAK